MNKSCIIIPVYNHSDKIRGLVNDLGRITPDIPIILVNDGSYQHCTQLLRELSANSSLISIIEREINGGKGAAVKTGLLSANRSGYTHALQVDADGQHDIVDAVKLLDLSEAHPDAVICAKPIYDDTVPKHRLYGRVLTHVWVWINTLSFDIQDAMCGFRVYPIAATVEIINSANIGNRMEFDPEILVRLHWQGSRFLYYPSRVAYHHNSVSHFRLVRDNIAIAWMHTRLFFGMITQLLSILATKRSSNE